VELQTNKPTSVHKHKKARRLTFRCTDLVDYT